jgi:hypothetical protein
MNVRRALALAAVVLCSACGLSLGREYEYEEQLYLSVDGSAVVVVNSSLAALAALRDLPIDPSPRAPFEPGVLRRLYESRGCDVLRVGAPWYRHGRRFVQIRVQTDQVATLDRCGPLGWSKYVFERDEEAIRFEQKVTASSGVTPPAVSWTGREIVAFRIHAPSKVLSHNVRRLADNSTGEVERGNILTWEQRLVDRQAGQPLDMQVKMTPDSILYRTLWLFAGSFLAAVIVLAALIWWTIRRGRARMAAGPASWTKRA